ncbi:ATP-binding region, ATPase-like domain protein [Candidatus Omnitrophus magneticus]|uniref:ATP-binding region, ATPase-like domain protein n=1 Tax=Candidatus Omnitrophus magneticus TaxID=1609969 RepID=A0A0F0CQG2_9BACT|nr:ATP-binding region, ATPase-like domain protein [Candidatus Omnitrophus magneticus]
MQLIKKKITNLVIIIFLLIPTNSKCEFIPATSQGKTLSPWSIFTAQDQDNYDYNESFNFLYIYNLIKHSLKTNKINYEILIEIIKKKLQETKLHSLIFQWEKMYNKNEKICLPYALKKDAPNIMVFSFQNNQLVVTSIPGNLEQFEPDFIEQLSATEEKILYKKEIKFTKKQYNNNASFENLQEYLINKLFSFFLGINWTDQNLSISGDSSLYYMAKKRLESYILDAPPYISWIKNPATKKIEKIDIREPEFFNSLLESTKNQTLRFVIYELIKNSNDACVKRMAGEHDFENIETARIGIIITTKNDKVIIRIADNGAGLINNQRLNFNFISKYNLIGLKGYDGIGIPWINALIEAHGGKITWKSPSSYPEKLGTIAEITLPLTSISNLSEIKEAASPLIDEKRKFSEFIYTLITLEKKSREKNTDNKIQPCSIIAVDTSWIPEIQRISIMRPLINCLSKINLGNTIIIFEDGIKLSKKITTAINTSKLPISKIIIIGEHAILTDKNFESLKNSASKETKIFFHEIVKPAPVPDNSYIDIIELLSAAAHSSYNFHEIQKEKYSFFEIKPNGKNKFIIFIKAIPMDFDKLETTYKNYERLNQNA